MNQFKIFFLLGIGLIFSFQSLSNQLADKISDEVFESLIGIHTKFLNSNILSEICQSPNYLEMNYASDKIKSSLLKEIRAIAKQRGVEEYNIKEVSELTELEFQAFQDGSRYAIFVARNFRMKENNAYCTVEIMNAISISQNEFLKQGGYKLKKRLIR